LRGGLCWGHSVVVRERVVIESCHDLRQGNMWNFSRDS